ncbi:MAG: energy transducer TonB [Vicinamibacteria bacterium]|nr:energy transducer TonB [Vicinamibacteria bacterium]
MRTRVFATAIALALTAPPAAADSEKSLPVGFEIVVGFPAAASEAAASTVVVPGFVIPLDGPEDARAAASERSTGLAQAVERLWATFRLDPARRPQSSRLALLAAGRRLELPSPAGIGLEASATLATFDDDAASLQVIVRRAGRVLADTAVRVKRGGRAVVGGMDGVEAPYVFVVVEAAAVGQPAVARLDDSVTAPELVHKLAPQYPLEARQAGVSGAVVLEAQIGLDGRVEAVRVARGADARLDEAAVAAVRQWRFKPARGGDGRPTRVLFTVTLRFALQ